MRNKEISSLNRVLIIVPHQDDEINLAGNILDKLTKYYEVYVLYSSLDRDGAKAKIRIREAINACGVWDIPEENIIFLRYPDTPNKAGTHFFTEEARHQEIVAKLAQWIVKLRPDYIFGTEFDYHPDHRMLSLALDEAMRKVLTENPEYVPVYLKGFCYDTAYYGVEDYSASMPGKCVPPRLPLANASLEWEKRISISGMDRAHFMLNRKAYHGLRRHRSQYAVLHARSVVNADNVFWRKRTDNLALGARIWVSSGNAVCLNDYKIIDTDDLITLNPREIDYAKGIWRPESDDVCPFVEVELPEPKYVETIIIHGNPNANDMLPLNGRIIIGSRQYQLSSLRPYGMDSPIAIGADAVGRIRFEFRESGHLKEFGISEIEIFSSAGFRLDEILLQEQRDELRYKQWMDVLDKMMHGAHCLILRTGRKIRNIMRGNSR